MDFGIRGKVAAVTGGGHGIGRAISRMLAAEGARVFVADVSAENLAATAEGTTIHTAQVDLIDRRAAAEWVALVEREAGGAIQILVNNVGGTTHFTPKPLEEVPDEEWDRITKMNLEPMFFTCRTAVPAMKRAGFGRIINISSGAGLKASIHPVQAYGIAKHGVVGFTRILAAELGRHGITANSVAPGLVLTSANRDRQWQSYGEAGQQALLNRIALRKLATADDVARAVLFFASDLAGMVTGEVIQVGGTI